MFYYVPCLEAYFDDLNPPKTKFQLEGMAVFYVLAEYFSEGYGIEPVEMRYVADDSFTIDEFVDSSFKFLVWLFHSTAAPSLVN
jgi:hypothetical protein